MIDKALVQRVVAVRTMRSAMVVTVLVKSGLAIAWHSDGKTYAADPGSFGSVSHVRCSYCCLTRTPVEH